MFKTLLYWLFILALLSLACLFAGYFGLKDWGTKEMSLTAPVTISLEKGENLRQFSHKLEKEGLVDNGFFFELWAKLFSKYKNFQAGPYRFEGKNSPDVIAQKIIKGDTYRPVLFKVTIPEGYTYKQFSEKLISDGIASSDELEQLFNDKDFILELGIPSTTLEGYLYPATYSFLKVPKARDVIKKAVVHFWKKLPSDYSEQIKAKGLSLNEAVTFASLIELETHLDEEKPLISEVIWKRLKVGAPLGIDAAIIYGIKDYNGNITRRHLKDASNPYNTRIQKGLPPTPIASPAISSLLAVLNPTETGNYYFVVDANDFDRHVFSKNFNEHQRNVRNYIQSNKMRKLGKR